MRNFAISPPPSACSATLALAQGVEQYKIDPNHSSANFAVKHMMVNTVHGRFTKLSGTIDYDPADPSKDKVTAVIDTNSITTDVAPRDNHLKSDAFFDVAKYPEIKFESTRVEKRGDQLVAIGNLTMKDVTKQIELPFEVAAVNNEIGVTATLKLNRQDYHVSWNHVAEGVTAVSDDVNIELNLEAKKAAGGDAAKSGK